MALSFTPQDVQSGYQSTELLNENFDNIQTALNDGLSRSGQSPNAMGADLDMQSHRIYNLPNAVSRGEPVTYGQYISGLPLTEFSGYAHEVIVATAGQTSFTTSAAYTPGLGALRVFVNGLHYPPSEYTETDANTVTFGHAMTAGDEVAFVITSFTEADYDTAGTVQYLQGATGTEYRTVESRLQEVYSVLDFGADDSGVADSTAAFQAAVDALPNGRGTIRVPPGTYRLNSEVVIESTRVYFDMNQNATINVYGDRGFWWKGTSSASPLSYGGISGGRILAGNTTPTEAVYITDFTRLKFEDMFVYGFYTEPDGNGTRAAFRTRYALGQTYDTVIVNRCDYGWDIAENALVTYRSTTHSWRACNPSRCKYGFYLKDVYGFEMDGQTFIENNAVGVYLAGEESGFAQASAGIISAYFEGNGQHIRCQGTDASSRVTGVIIDGASFEGVDANYSGTATPFPVADPGEYKIYCDYAERIAIRNCYWQSTTTADIKILATCDDCVIGWQLRNYASIADSGVGTVYERAWSEATALPAGDTTPSVKGICVATITNGAPVTITQFDDGFAGQVIHLVPQDGNTTITHDGSGAGIRLMGATNKTLAAGQVISFVCIGSNIWHQMGATSALATYTYTPTNVSTDRSYDANATTTDELADVLGTLIADLQARGIIQ